MAVCIEALGFDSEDIYSKYGARYTWNAEERTIELFFDLELPYV